MNNGDCNMPAGTLEEFVGGANSATQTDTAPAPTPATGRQMTRRWTSQPVPVAPDDEPTGYRPGDPHPSAVDTD